MSSSQFEKAESGEITEVPEVHVSRPRDALGSSPTEFRKFGNPGPVGVLAFAATTLELSLFNVSVRGIHVTNAVVAMSLFSGGLTQFIAGMWEFASGNTFGATVFTLYGGFWMSYATIFIPGSGITAAYADHAGDFATAIGVYLMMWFIITFLIFIASTRKSIGMCAIMFFLLLTFLMLGIGELVPATSAGTTKAGGVLGIITAFIGFYIGLAQLLIREESWFTLPVGNIPQRLD